MTVVPFCFEHVSFHCKAAGLLRFPSPLPANLLRGALGTTLMRRPDEYARIFAPTSEDGPSGLVHRPRPFVFRAAHLAGVSVGPQQMFSFDLHVFDAELVGTLVDALSAVLNEGVGPARVPVHVARIERTRREVDWEALRSMDRVVVEFATPTELKHQGQLAAEPAFAVLIALVRTRLQNLCAFYGAGRVGEMPSGWLEAVRAVRIMRADLKHVNAMRVSTRTGQRHPIGGFVGTIAYAGDVTEFLPYVSAAQYTGVGRQTTWGKGELRVSYDHSS